MNHPTDDQYINLLGGLASPEEEKAILAHVKACAACEDRLRLLSRDREQVAAEPRPRFVDGTILYPEDVAAPQGGSVAEPRRRRRWRPALAAAVVAVIVAVLLWPRGSSDPLEYWLPTGEIIEPQIRAIYSPAVRQQFRDAVNAYGDHNPGRALELLRTVDIEAGEEPFVSLRDLYIASAFILTDRPEEAVPLLEGIDIPTIPGGWRERAQWVEYVCYRSLGRSGEADSLLFVLETADGDIGSRARHEIQRLDLSREGR